MKKAQIEIIGLFVIIILLAIAILIALRFILREEPDTLESQRDQLRSTALMNSLFATNVDYVQDNSKKIRDELAICMSIGDGCDAERDKINDILNEILNNEKYFLRIEDKLGVTLFTLPTTLPIEEQCDEDAPYLITSNGIVFNSPQINYRFGLCTK